MLEIRAPRELRWERLLERGRTGDAETFEQFSMQEESELVAHDESGQALIATGKMADVVINNNFLKLYSVLCPGPITFILKKKHKYC